MDHRTVKGIINAIVIEVIVVGLITVYYLYR